MRDGKRVLMRRPMAVRRNEEEFETVAKADRQLRSGEAEG
jgi:hypothetical protein